MPRKTKPEDVAAEHKWDIGDLTEFCALVLEEANDHNTAAALRALNAGAYGLARDFILLEEDHNSAGELTPELQERRSGLLNLLKQAETP
jgi:hypothetical protein